MKSKVQIIILTMFFLTPISLRGADILRYDGLYEEQGAKPGASCYVRFYEDGTVLGFYCVTPHPKIDTRNMAGQGLNKTGKVGKGSYLIKGNRITFTTNYDVKGNILRNDCEGEIQGETITLKRTFKAKDKKKEFDEVYKFISYANFPISSYTKYNPYVKPVSISLNNVEGDQVAKKEIKYSANFPISEAVIDPSTGKEIRKWSFDKFGRRQEPAMFLCLDQKGNIIRDKEGNPYFVKTFPAREKSMSDIIYNRYNPMQKEAEYTTIYPCENCKNETGGMCDRVW